MNPRGDQSKPNRDGPRPQGRGPGGSFAPRTPTNTPRPQPEHGADRPVSRGPSHNQSRRPPLTIFTTTLWEYPSQHYDSPRLGEIGPKGQPGMQGDKNYIGATPSWVIWQLLMRYTREGDTIVDPMCGSGTTLDVCNDLNRKGIGFDVSPIALAARDDLRRGDARNLPLANDSADFVFLDPPYSTHVDYSDDPACIGKLDALADDNGKAYYEAMDRVIDQVARILKPRRYMGLYVSDSFKKVKGRDGGKFAPIGFRLFESLSRVLTPVDTIAVVRHNQKLARGNWKKAAEEGNFFLRGFNYLFIFKKT